MPRVNEEKKAEARRLVERDGLSLAAAAERVGVAEKTVRVWQKADEQAGDGWQLPDGRSSKAQSQMAGLSDEERAAQVERARRATQARWVNRRESEGDATGIAASAARAQVMNTLPRIAAAVGTDNGPLAAQLSLTAQRLTVTFGILIDKAERLTGAAQPTSAGSSEDSYQGDLAAVHDLMAKINTARRAG